MSATGPNTAKTMVLDLIENPNRLATEISRRWTQWKTARRDWETGKRELREYIFATSTDDTANAALPWKNKTTLPKLCQIRDNLHANYMAALFPNRNWFKWEGADNDSVLKEKVAAIEAYMRNKTRVAQFRNEVSRLVYDYIDYGNAFADVEYVRQVSLDERGGEVPGFVGPRLVRVNPLDHVFNVAASTYEAAPKITRSMLSLGDVKKLISMRPEAGYLEEVFAQMVGARQAFGGLAGEKAGFTATEQEMIDGFRVDGFGTPQDYFESGMVEILEFEGDMFDASTGELMENHVITVVDRMFILRSEQVKNWLGRSTKHHVGWRLRPDNLMAMGPLDNLVGMQYRQDHLENLKADVFDLIAYPVLKVRGEVDDFTYAPNERIYMDTDGDVSALVPDTTALNADFQIQRLQDQMEEMAGAPKQAMGFRTPGEKTAFEVSTLASAAGRIFQNKISFFEEQFLEPLMNAMLESARRNLDGKDIVDVIDDDIGVREFLELTREDITATGVLKPVGARHFAEKAQIVQNISQFSNSALGQDPKVNIHFSGKMTAKMLEEALGLSQYNIYQPNIAIEEQAETQRILQVAQDDVQTDAVTPEEELTEEDINGVGEDA